MTTTFYAPPECITDGRLVLPDDEARHAVRTLRHAVGDEIVVVDGAGGRYRVRLTEADKRSAAGEVLAAEREAEPPRLVIGLGVLKNAGRFETFAEKAVELGVTGIVPLETERTERSRIKPARLEHILVAALKQSGRSRLPALAEPTPLADVLARDTEGLRLLCHEAAAPEALLPRALDRNPGGSVTILVGPEGGFSEAEVAEAEAAGWIVVSLGPLRLRAETAAIAAAATAMLASLHPPTPT